MSLNFLRKIAMSEPLFDDWDDFMDSVDSLVEKGIVERYIWVMVKLVLG